MLKLKVESLANAKMEGEGVDVRNLATMYDKVAPQLEFLASNTVNNKGAFSGQLRQEENTVLNLGTSTMEWEFGDGQYSNVTVPAGEGKKRKRGVDEGGSYFEKKVGHCLVSVVVQCASLEDDATTKGALMEFFEKFPGRSKKPIEEKLKRVRCSKGQASIAEGVNVDRLMPLENNLNAKAGGSGFRNIIGIGYAAMIFQLPGKEHITYVVKDEEALVSAVKELAKLQGYSEGE